MSDQATLIPKIPPEVDQNSIEFVTAMRVELLKLEDASNETLGPCPEDLIESYVDVPLSDGFVSKVLVIRPASKSIQKCPLVIYLHGGSITYGSPNFVKSPARGFASHFGVVVASPSYKLTPEHPFPAPVQSAWEAISWLSDPENLNQGLLKDELVEVDPSRGFVIGGCSAGAHLTTAIVGIDAAAKAGNTELTRGLPPISSTITGLFITVPQLMYTPIVPPEYLPLYRSLEEHANAPFIDAEHLRNSEKRHKPDIHSPWFSSLNLDLEKIREHYPPKVYIQGGELDVLRDDAVVFERVLRDKNITKTRIDIVQGVAHSTWCSLPLPDAHTQEIKEVAMDGLAWVLDTEWDRDQPLPY
ncbi:Alpha/Beta hydrolase protein [Xylariales sp. PMI_506]|nr:Alpha/Beta hydrolase protein [Xylariales sp. PMI_506]